MGKGRQIGALIRQHWSEGGRHVLWVSVSNDLRRDAERDLKDVGARSVMTYPRVSQGPAAACSRVAAAGMAWGMPWAVHGSCSGVHEMRHLPLAAQQEGYGLGHG